MNNKKASFFLPDVANLKRAENIRNKLIAGKPLHLSKNNKPHTDLTDGLSIELQPNPVILNNGQKKTLKSSAETSQNTLNPNDKFKRLPTIEQLANDLKNGKIINRSSEQTVTNSSNDSNQYSNVRKKTIAKEIFEFDIAKRDATKTPLWNFYDNYRKSSSDNEIVKQINDLVNNYSYTDLALAEDKIKKEYDKLFLKVLSPPNNNDTKTEKANLIYRHYILSEAKKIRELKNTDQDWAAFRANKIFGELTAGDLNETYLADTALEQLIEKKISADENYKMALNGTLSGMAGDGTEYDADDKIIHDAKIEAEALEYALLLFTNYLAENYTLPLIYQMYLSADSKLNADSLEHPGNLTEHYKPEQLMNQKSMPVAKSILKDAFNIRKETHPDDKIYNEIEYIGKYFGHSWDTIVTNISNATDFAWGLHTFSWDDSHERIGNRTKALQANARTIESRAPLSRGLGAMRMIGHLPEQAPQIALSMVNPTLGLVYTGISSFGSAYGEAAASGASISEATTYGALNAGVEIALEKFVGDGLVGGEGIFSKKVAAFIKKSVSNPAVRATINYLVDKTSEGFEEILATFITPYLQRIANVPVDSPTFNDYAYSFGNALFNSVFYSGVASTVKSQRANSSDFSTYDIQNTLDNSVKKGVEFNEIYNLVVDKTNEKISVKTLELPENNNITRAFFVKLANKLFPSSVINADTGEKISISRKGIDKFLSGRISNEKYASGFVIPELIENGIKVGEAPNLKGKEGIYGYDYYESDLNIDKEPYRAYIRVRNTNMGNKYYGHTIGNVVDKIEIEPLARTSENTVQPVNAINSISDKIIPQKTDTVNEDYSLDLAIGNIIDGKATFEDFKLFEQGNTYNRNALHEVFGFKLPEDKNGTILNLLYITNKNAIRRDFPTYFYNKYYGKREFNLDLYLSEIYNKHIGEIKNAGNIQTSTEHIKTRNERLEGKVHPMTSVHFAKKTIIVNDKAYDVVVPEFESLFDAQIGEGLYFKTDNIQFKECNRQLLEAVNSDANLSKRFSEAQLKQIRKGKVPDGYVWHHDAEVGKLQLIDRYLHEKTGHTGGKKIWGGGSEYR